MPDPKLSSLQKAMLTQPPAPTNPIGKFLADYNSDVIDRTHPQSLGSRLGEGLFDLRNTLSQYHFPQDGLLAEFHRQLQGNQPVAPQYKLTDLLQSFR